MRGCPSETEGKQGYAFFFHKGGLGKNIQTANNIDKNKNNEFYLQN